MTPSGSLTLPRNPSTPFEDGVRQLSAILADIEAKSAQCGELLDAQYEASRRMIQAQGFYYPDELPHRAEIAKLTAKIKTLESVLVAE